MKKININRDNIFYFIAKMVVSVMIGLSFFLDSILVFKKENERVYWSNTKYWDVYFNNPKLSNYLIFVFASVISFCIISIFIYLLDKYKNRLWKKEAVSNDKVFIIIFLCIFIMWLPYILSFFPGGFNGDIVSEIYQAIGKWKINNHQPVLYTLLIGLFFNISNAITGSYQTGFVVFGILQILLMNLMISYFIFWWYKKGINTYIIVLLTAFFGLFKLFPLYAVTIWKDTPFSLFLVFMCFQISDIVMSKGEKLKDNRFIVTYIINIILISFLRNNGVYVVIGSTILLIFAYRNYKKFLISTFITMSIIVIIQGPIYNILKIQGGYQEKIGIPLSSICYIIVKDGNISEEQMNYLNSIVSIETVKKIYSPWNIDYVKFDSNFNVGLLKKNKAIFFKTWIQLVAQNPKLAIEAYMLNTTGFWNINRVYNGDIKDYINPITEYQDMNDLGLQQINILYRITGNSIVDYLYDRNEISTAIFIFIILISITSIFKIKKYKILLIYIPIIILLGTTLIATPIAFGLRYVYSVVIFTPFGLLYPTIKLEE